MPYYSEDFTYYYNYPGFTYTLTRVVEGVEKHRIAYSFDNFPDDGVCKDGYYRCVGSDRCIGISAVCDGYNHCGDNSDEIHSGLNCTLKDQCEGEFSCRHGSVCKFEYDSLICMCGYGYRGERCEYSVQGCSMECLNGGTCIAHVCNCADDYYGDRCQQGYECDPPCQNGGTCTSQLQCICADDCASDTCDCGKQSIAETEVDESMGSGRLLYIILPIVVGILILCILLVLLARRRTRRRRRHRQQNEPSKTSQTVIYTAVPVTSTDKNATGHSSNHSVGEIQNCDETAPQATIEEAVV
ncbi:uncharacterized protein LOC144433865 [Glandiceps talaboti]